MNGGERRGVFLFFFSLSQHCGNEFLYTNLESLPARAAQS